MTIGGTSTIAPRTRFVAVPYAYKADTANYALAATSADNAWARAGADSVLYTSHHLGVAKGGAKDTLYGALAFTQVNLGDSSVTGRSNGNRSYCVVSGGYGNRASSYYATVGGGGLNTANDWYTTIGGGAENFANVYSSTVGGSR